MEDYTLSLIFIALAGYFLIKAVFLILTRRD
jgi:hypothetical protein